MSTPGTTRSPAIACSSGRAVGQRHVEEVLAVEVQEVEQEGHDSLGRRVGVDLGHRVLKARRAAVAHPQGLAVEHDLA